MKTVDTDGYNAVQVAYDEVADYKITKPEVGHCAKAGVAPMRHLEEFRLAQAPAHELGQQLKPSEMFTAGDLVDVRGASIGKGWQGAVKKYGFSRGLMTHGSKSHRQHGSSAPAPPPAASTLEEDALADGQRDGDRPQLKVVKVEDDCIIVKGSVPGKRGNRCASLRRRSWARTSRRSCLSFATFFLAEPRSGGAMEGGALRPGRERAARVRYTLEEKHFFL